MATGKALLQAPTKEGPDYGLQRRPFTETLHGKEDPFQD
jgi:hypothetical protein